MKSTYLEDHEGWGMDDVRQMSAISLSSSATHLYLWLRNDDC